MRRLVPVVAACSVIGGGAWLFAQSAAPPTPTPSIVPVFRDCAVSGNVPSMRNRFSLESLLERSYVENASLQPGPPSEVVPKLLPKARPVHEVVEVDVYLQGCPPPADVIWALLTGLLEGQLPDLTSLTRPGR